MKNALIIACLLSSQLAPGQVIKKVNVLNTTVQVDVYFSAAPASVTVTHADLKYNKQGVFQFELDDNSKGMRDVAAIWGGIGKAQDSTVYAGLSYTDGCGNNVKFRAALAINGRGGFLNQEISDVSQKAFSYTWPEMKVLIQNDWMIENHSYYHDPTTRYSYKYDAGRNYRELHKLAYDRLRVLGTEYVIRTAVGPTNWTNFARTADSLGYLCFTSTGTRDGYPLYPASGQTYFDTKTLPAGFITIGRAVDDAWSTASVATWKTTFDGIVSGSSATVHRMWRLFSHGPQNVTNFLDFSNYVAANHQDKIWISTMQELREYDEVKRLVRRSQTLTGNHLTILLNLSRVPDINRFRDMSLLVSAGGPSITSVTVTGADGMSYNPTSGLINIFKKKIAGFPAQ